VLTERKKMTVRSIEEFKKQLDNGTRRHQPLSDKEIQDRKQIQLKALPATTMPK